MNISRILIISTLVLLLLAVGAFWLYYAGALGLGDLWLNVATEIVGILLTLLLVDQVIRAAEDRSRHRVEIVALHQITGPLNGHIRLLCNLMKAGLNELPDKNTTTLRDLLTEHLMTAIKFFDFSGAAPTVPGRQWFDHLHTQFDTLEKNLTKTIEKYAAFLEPNFLEYLEALANSSLMGFMIDAEKICTADIHLKIKRTYNILADDSMRALVAEHINALLRVIDHHDTKLTKGRLNEVPGDLWRSEMEPKLGSARVENSEGPPVRAGLDTPWRIRI